MKRAIIIPLTALAAAVLLGGSSALASVPDPGGVIHGCYKSSPPVHGASLKVIDTGAGGACGAGQKSLTWNQAGPQGATGPQGPAGAAGVSGFEVDSCESDAITSPLCTQAIIDGGYRSIQLLCPAGKVAFSGGFHSNAAVSPASMLAMFPIDSGAGYQFEWDNLASIETVYVTCAAVAA
jgi:hypothetical protein